MLILDGHGLFSFGRVMAHHFPLVKQLLHHYFTRLLRSTQVREILSIVGFDLHYWCGFVVIGAPPRRPLFLYFYDSVLLKLELLLILFVCL